MSFHQMMEPPHLSRQSTSQPRPGSFQNRASQIFKKVASLRGRLGAKNTIKPETVSSPYKRQARSMDGRTMPFMSQPVLGLETTSPADDGSSRSASTSDSPQQFSANLTWSALGHNPNRMAKSESMPGKARANAVAAIAPSVDTHEVAIVRTPVVVPNIVVSNHSTPARAPTEQTSSKPTPVITNLAPTIHKLPSLATASVGTPARVVVLPAPTPIILPASPSKAIAPTSTRSPRPSTSPASVPGNRTASLCIADMPTSVFQMNENGCARLSPSIINRPPPMPILNLPLLPVPTNAVQQQRVPARPQSNLRSMPALSVDGTNELNHQSDHENSMLDSDEEDEEDAHTLPSGGSDEEGEDLAPSHSTAETPVHALRRMKLPSIDTGRMDLSFIKSPKAGLSSAVLTNRRDMVDAPPTASSSFDYFSINSTGPSGTPRAATRKLAITPELPPSSPRPAMYHQVSRSMIDLLTPKPEQVIPVPVSAIEPPAGSKGKAPDRLHHIPPVPEYTQQDQNGTSLASPLRRQRSMPIFNATSEPPPYPHFAPHSMRAEFIIQPREDEGMECLPGYSNAIHLVAIMPRKMEFTSPGVQAKDRKWRRALCELEGTAFRVYKCPPGVTGGGVIGEWWEKKVGAGDATAVATSISKPDAPKEVLEQPSKLTEDAHALARGAGEESRTEPPSHTTTVILPKPKRLAASLLHPIVRSNSNSGQSRSHSRSRSDTPEPVARSSLNNFSHSSSSQLGNTPCNASNSNISSSVTSSNTSPPSSASRSHFLPKASARHRGSARLSLDAISCPDHTDLIRAYSLQNAESGLGNDYAKRKNVIRVRMEGEQFLLQAHDVADVVEWIEGFHAATNIALDLDERVMPKGPMFPRRRRRRHRPEALTEPATTT